MKRTFPAGTKSVKQMLWSYLTRLILPLSLGMAILWFIFKDTSFTHIVHVFKQADYGILGFSLLFGWIANTIRALRWRKLFLSLGHRISGVTLAYAVYGTYAVNFVFPRAGEIWRCLAVSKTEGVSLSQTVSTMVLDRILDCIFMFIIVSVVMVSHFSFLSQHITHLFRLQQISLPSMSTWTMLSIACALISVVGIIVILKRYRKKVTLLSRIWTFFSSIKTDLKAFAGMKNKATIIIYSIGIWVGYFLYFYITLFAFSFTKHLSLSAGLIAFTLGSIGTAFPTNGGIGAWHAAVIGALLLYGVKQDEAEAFAFGIFAIQSLWFILLGLLGIILLAFRKKKQI